MLARRLLWAGAAIAAALWLARAARAEAGPDEAPEAARMRPSAAATDPPSRRSAFAGYAAESVRTATRLPPEERAARGFLQAAALASRFELEASRIALARARPGPVRDFADDLFRRHEAAQLELLHLLHARGMAPPFMDNPQRKALQRLARLPEGRFEREYLAAIGARRQREQAQQHERALRFVSDAQVRAWIERRLPELRAHQATAERLARAESPKRVEGTRQAALARPPAGARQRSE